MRRASNQSVDLTEFKDQIDRVVARVRDDDAHVTLVVDGAPVAVLLPYRDLARLERLDEREREAREIIQDMRAAFADVPAEEVEREAAKALADVRAEMRAERQCAVTTR